MSTSRRSEESLRPWLTGTVLVVPVAVSLSRLQHMTVVVYQILGYGSVRGDEARAMQRSSHGNGEEEAIGYLARQYPSMALRVGMN